MKWRLMIFSNFIYSFAQGIYLPFFVYTLILKIGLKSVGIFYSLFNMFIGFSIGVSFYINRKISERDIIFLATLFLSPLNFYSIFWKDELLLMLSIILVGFLYGVQISPSSELSIRVSEVCLYLSLLSYYFGMGLGGYIFYKYSQIIVENYLFYAAIVSLITWMSAFIFYFATKNL